MGILREYDIKRVLYHHFNVSENASKSMKNAIKIYWLRRRNEIAKSRIKSAIGIIKILRCCDLD